MQYLFSNEVETLLGKSLSAPETIDELFFGKVNNDNAVTGNSINPLFLPKAKVNLLEDLEAAAVTWLETTKSTDGINQILSIEETDFSSLIAILVSNAIPGCWNFIDFNSNFKANCSPSGAETGLIFDTETFVTSGNLPIIATAISNLGLYIWLSKSWDGVTEYSPELVDLRDYKRLIIAHNISFDFCRVKQRFQINNPVQGLCTMALAKSLYSSSRENQWLLNADPKVNTAAAILQKISCKMSLVAVYEFITNTKLPADVKDIRKTFVVAEQFSDFLPLAHQLFTYALTDTILTLEVFKKLYPAFIEQSKSPIVLQGIIQSADALLPIIPDYSAWITNNEKAANSVDFLLFKALLSVATEIHEGWLAGTIVPDDFPESLAKLNWKFTKPFGWRKRQLPENYPKMAKWFSDFNTGNFAWGGNNLAYLLQLNWKNMPLKRTMQLGWHYTDKWSQLDHRLPHPSGDEKANLGCITSGSCLTYAEQNLITSSVISQDDLIYIYRLLDSTSILSGYGDRLKEIQISF